MQRRASPPALGLSRLLANQAQTLPEDGSHTATPTPVRTTTTCMLHRLSFDQIDSVLSI
jgi:hypothetical protein